MSACPCTPGVLPSGRGLDKQYADCCGRLHSGAENAASAAALMCSRYSAYVLGLEPYLLSTWHASTRPSSLNLAETMDTKWLGLEVKSHQQQDEAHATVEFIARYRIAGRGHRLHELSHFVREEGRWYYVAGEEQPIRCA